MKEIYKKEKFKSGKILTSLNINSLQKKRPALFIDRDGVIIEDLNYLSDPARVKLCRGAAPVLKEAFKKNLPVVIVTNQSGIARGFYEWESYEKVTLRMIDLLEVPCPITAIYANGFAPSKEKADWRKPNPGMLFAAAKDLSLDLSKSIMIGDRLSDLQAGTRAGVKLVVHVLTGHGENERSVIKQHVDDSNYFWDKGNSSEVLLINSLDKFSMEINTNQKYDQGDLHD